MNWTLNEPQAGDIVRVKVGNFYHYGIFVSDDEIIQFGLPPTDLKRDNSTVAVCQSDIDTFLEGKFLEIGTPDKKEKKKMLSSNQIIENARARLGEKGYHILYNNCEHFVFQCAFGEKVSSQVDDVRKMWKTFPFVNVYIEKFPFNVKNKTILPKQREREIENCGNEKVREEKFYDWKLLEHGIKQSLGLDIKNVSFDKKDYKWVCDDFEFSLSHSADVVAVVVARNPVGIDIEEKNNERFQHIPFNRILSEEELAQYNLDPEGANKIWTVKEALFKQEGSKLFNPTKVCTLNKKYTTKEIIIEDKSYYLTVATNDLNFIKYYCGENVKIK